MFSRGIGKDTFSQNPATQDFAFLSEVRKRKKSRSRTFYETGCYVCEGHIEQSVKGQRDSYR